MSLRACGCCRPCVKDIVLYACGCLTDFSSWRNELAPQALAARHDISLGVEDIATPRWLDILFGEGREIINPMGGGGFELASKHLTLHN